MSQSGVMALCYISYIEIFDFNIANNFVLFPSTHFIFGMHVYLMETFNLIPNIPRSKSGVKVKFGINVSKFSLFADNFIVLCPLSILLFLRAYIALLCGALVSSPGNAQGELF